MHHAQALIREVADFPKPPVRFYDIAPLLADAKAFATVIEALAQCCAEGPVTHVAAIESRGFILGAALAQRLGAGVVMLRKPNRLPGPTWAAPYALEYGESTLHLQRDALHGEDQVVLVDDVIATGGTLAAGSKLVTLSGATLVRALVLIELSCLGGRARLSEGALESLVTY